MIIDKFSGKYIFLSNFWPAPVMLDSVLYPTVEHAYQAAKRNDPDYRSYVLAAPKANIAKSRGRGKEGPDWYARNKFVMKDLLRQKFAEPSLRAKLLATGDVELIEGNYWGDIFWGVCDGKGQNWLGKLLMEVRQEILDKQAEYSV